MDNNSETPCPFVTADQLGSLVHKPVVIAGKVESINEHNLVLDTGNGNKVNVNRSKPILIPVEMGNNILLRGFVNPDLSIGESKTFPPTVLGDQFDLGLYSEAAAVTSSSQFVHMFNN